MARGKIKDTIEDIVKVFLEEESLELYHVEFVKEGKDWFLRVYIDKLREEDGYISMDECEKVSRFLSEKLDELDLIEQEYYLEVSSPGVERGLFEPRHFVKALGKMVELSFYKGIDGKKTAEGILVNYIDENITIKNEKDEEKIYEQSQVAKARLVAIF